MNECRLCSYRTDLINIFDPILKNSRELRCFIVLATGIEIKETDVASKYVCRRCCILAIKIYKFRTKAIANDKALKEQCGQHYSPPPSPPLSGLDTSQNQISTANLTNENKSSPAVSKAATLSPPKNRKIPIARKHPSVYSITKKYPNIIMPSQVFSSHIDPVITLDKDEVNEWFQMHDSRRETVLLNDLHKKLTNITIRKVAAQHDKENNQLNKNNTDTVTNLLAYHDPVRDKKLKQHEVSIENSSLPNNSTYNRRMKQNLNINVAKKKTSGVCQVKSTKKRPEKRKRLSSESDSSDAELMPIPKKRHLIKPPSGLQKIDLPTEKPTSKETQKQIFTSSLELTPIRAREEELLFENDRDLPNTINLSSGKNILCTIKETQLFVCNICNKICDTRRELVDHQRSHLHCKFCKTKMKNIEALLEHLNEACFINLTKNLPNILLRRVDEDPVVKIQFKDAFMRLNGNSEICKSEHHINSNDEFESDNDSIGGDTMPQIEEINIPMTYNNFVEETEVTTLPLSSTSEPFMNMYPEKTQNSLVNNQLLINALLKDSPKSSDKKKETLLEQYISRAINEADKKDNKNSCTSQKDIPSEDNVVCISDESDGENSVPKKTISLAADTPKVDSTPMESVSVIRPEIKLAHNSILNPQTSQSVVNQNLASLEESIIQNLFKKYCIAKTKTDAIQVFTPCDSSIKTLGNRLMSVENMFFELPVHKIPVELEFNEKIKIAFQKVLEKAKPAPNFDWQKYNIKDITLKSSNGASPVSANEIIQIDDDENSSITPDSKILKVDSNLKDNITQSAKIFNGKFITNPKSTFTITTSSVTPLTQTVSELGASNTSEKVKMQLNNLPKIVISQSNASNSNNILSNQETAQFSSGTILIQQPSTNTRLIQPVVIPQSQIASSASGTIVLNQLPSQNGLISGQKILTLSQPIYSQSLTVQRPHMPTVLNTNINNYNKIVVITPSGNANLVQPVTTPSIENSVQIKEIEEPAGTSNNSQQPSSAENHTTGSKQCLLRVKKLWELTDLKS